MKYVLPKLFAALVLLAQMSHAADAADISGEGGSFPDSVYSEWSSAYKSLSGIGLNYLPTGSGEGIKKIETKSVDFGASDEPLSPEELAKNGLMQFPTVAGGVVPIVNVIGVKSGKIKLDGKSLADIYLGKITKWNDPRLVALNPDIKLPDADITVIYRSDNSGTTFIFTDYLSKVSPEWKAAMGEGKSVKWKVGKGCKGNLMVPICLSLANNSIAYTNYASAVNVGMSLVQLKNRSGAFVVPSASAFQAAAAHGKWDQGAGFYEMLTDEPGDTSWPIVGATYIMMYKMQDKPDNAREALAYFDWALAAGDEIATEKGYVPLPEKVKQLVRNAWTTQITDKHGKAICPNSCTKVKAANS